MDKLISVGFQFITTLIFALRRSAEYAPAFFPGMLYPLKPDITLGIIELRHREFTIREL